MSRFSRKQIVVLSVAALAIAAIAIAAISVCCSHHTYPRELVVADSLCESNPPKAISHLNALRVKSKSMGTADFWYYRLLCVKARDKAYIPATDVKEAQTIVNHYESFGADKSKLQYAYYYLGRAYRDLDDIPMALEFYKKALELVGHNDKKFLSILNFQVGFLLLEQSLSGEALPYFKTSYQLEEQRRDTVMIIYSLQKIAYAYQDEKNDSCLMFYKKALQLSKKSRNAELYNSILSSLGSYYLTVGKNEEAYTYAKPALCAVTEDNQAWESFVYVAAKSCMNLNKRDSALAYYLMLDKSDNVGVQWEANLSLSQLFLERGNVSKTLSCLKKLNECEKILKRDHAVKSAAHWNAAYNYSLYKDKNSKLEKRNLFLIVSLCVIAFSVILCIMAFVMWYRRNKQREREREIRLRKIREENAERSLEYVKTCEDKIHSLEMELQEAKLAHSESLENLRLQYEQAVSLCEIAKQKISLKENIMATFVNTAIYQTIARKARSEEVLTEEDLLELETEITEKYPAFRSSLFTVSPISVQDYRMCIIIKLFDFNDNIMSKLLSRDRSTITKAKKKLQIRYLGAESSIHDFITFIKGI